MIETAIELAAAVSARKEEIQKQNPGKIICLEKLDVCETGIGKMLTITISIKDKE